MGHSTCRIFFFPNSAVTFPLILSILSILSSVLVSVSADVPIYGIQVLKEFDHDPGAFTQGLLYTEKDILYESTGLYGESSVRRVALATGKVEAIHRLNETYFGEGLTLLNERLYQVTWLTDIGFVYHRSNLSKIETFNHQMTDGWGLATDGKILFGSDGTSILYHIDPRTMQVVKKYTVKYEGHDVTYLNELEYINGEVWANIWQSDCIARLSRYGRLLGWIYLPSLRQELIANGHSGIDVLNGIAWDRKRNRIFVTGKLWPKLYQIRVKRMKKPFEGDIKKLCLRGPSPSPSTSPP